MKKNLFKLICAIVTLILVLGPLPRAALAQDPGSASSGKRVVAAEAAPDGATAETPQDIEPTATGSEPEATAEPEATQEPATTPEPEATNEPTATPEPEATDEATATPEPTATHESASLEEKSGVEAVIYTDATCSTPAEDTSTIAVSGMLPVGASIKAYPVALTMEELGQDLQSHAVLAAYDITIYDAKGNVYQPEEHGETVTVAIHLPWLEELEAEIEDVKVYHLDAAEEELLSNDLPQPLDSDNVSVAGTTVTFEADSFSQYVIVGNAGWFFRDYLSLAYTTEDGSQGSTTIFRKFLEQEGEGTLYVPKDSDISLQLTDRPFGYSLTVKYDETPITPTDGVYPIVEAIKKNGTLVIEYSRPSLIPNWPDVLMVRYEIKLDVGEPPADMISVKVVKHFEGLDTLPAGGVSVSYQLVEEKLGDDKLAGSGTIHANAEDPSKEQSLTFQGLEADKKYILTETVTDIQGYALSEVGMGNTKESADENKVSDGPYSFDVETGEKGVTEVHFVNTYEKNLRSITILKVGADGRPLANAVFELKKHDDAGGGLTAVGTPLTTDTSGTIVFFDLLPGNYQLSETAGPDGYAMLGAPIELEVTKEGIELGAETSSDVSPSKDAPYTITVVNHPILYSLPQTGGSGNSPLLKVGITAILVAAISLITLNSATNGRKKKNRA